VFVLHRTHGVALASALRLVTCNPARAVGIDGETGSIEAGKRADLLAVRVLSDGSPVVTTAFVNGERVFSSAYRR
jgi:alpha-D-ribose 1-methylphosphonate 5-triphosphate diphosphatase PhnM